jgi:hypothetical protein
MMTNTDPSGISKRAALIGFCIAFVTGLVSSKWMLPESNTPPSIPAVLLNFTAPIAINIDYRPTLKSYEGTTRVSGTAYYKFTNTTDRPMQISFPPHRVFGFSVSSVSPNAEMPKFAMKRSNIMIPAKDSVTFENEEDSVFIGNIRSFLKGGPGWIGFVFESPKDCAADSNFCVGTVFPQYTVFPTDLRTQSAEPLKLVVE